MLPHCETMMQYGLYCPNFGQAISARTLATLAAEAEASGWDGFFLWDHMLHSRSQRAPLVDPWVALAAMSMTTTRIRLGTALTPLARRRPWKLARETVTLDHLCQGRLTLTVGLGHPPEADFAQFGEDPDPRVRAAKLDEGLEVLVGLWSGKRFSYTGAHYQIAPSVFLPRPVQTPRIPIWVGGFWPHTAPFRRAAHWDGAFPLKTGGAMRRQDLQEIRDYIAGHRTSAEPFDLVMMGYTPADDPQKAQKIIAPYAAAGLTWWLESLFRRQDSLESMQARIRNGPPMPG